MNYRRKNGKGLKRSFFYAGKGKYGLYIVIQKEKTDYAESTIFTAGYHR